MILKFPESRVEVHQTNRCNYITPFIIKGIGQYIGGKGSSPYVHYKFTKGPVKFTLIGWEVHPQREDGLEQ